MPIIRIEQKGFQGFNGLLGSIQFKDGVSTEAISQAEAERIGSFMKITNVDDNRPISVSQRMLDAKRKNLGDLGIQHQSLIKIERTKTGKFKEPIKKLELPALDYTRETLEGLADTGGLKDLRDFAKGFGITGRAINEIIESMMQLKADDKQTE